MLIDQHKKHMELPKGIEATKLAGIYTVERPTYPDERGFFRETFRASELESVIGQEFKIIQENHSRSTKGTVRGIHIAPWNKFIYVPRGEVQAIIVDLRPESETFGQYISVLLGENNRKKIWVPKYCGNAYLVLSEEADYTYLVDQEWSPNAEFGIKWDDSDLAIEWQLDGVTPVLSAKDQQNETLRQHFPEKF